MSIQVKRRREAAGFLAGYVGAAGELLVDTTNNRVLVQDGVTAGGFAAAKLSEVPCSRTPHGAGIQFWVVEEAVTCSGALSSSVMEIPSRSLVFSVSVRVLTSISGANSFNVDATTGPGGELGSVNGRFGSAIGTSTGVTNSGLIGPTVWYFPSAISIIAIGGAFTAGVVRIAIHYATFDPPAS
ncbi:hypothetical protein [Methylocapsa acidiphila]|uniref:hyaluronate lyase N-terminal domain-containing protein n=1 Tax=Methylocapsa acidiphila TaxID=133552 RepID=UPI0012EC1F04|nr:hypothetical protein [Methylocapsa acidiphila]